MGSVHCVEHSSHRSQKGRIPVVPVARQRLHLSPITPSLQLHTPVDLLQTGDTEESREQPQAGRKKTLMVDIGLPLSNEYGAETL